MSEDRRLRILLVRGPVERPLEILSDRIYSHDTGMQVFRDLIAEHVRPGVPAESRIHPVAEAAGAAGSFAELVRRGRY